MIDINLNNYEEYFIDYFDGNLSPSEVNELMSFLELHPNLKEEFSEFNAECLIPEVTSYNNKNKLKKESLLFNKNCSNFDELCIAKIEGDLSIQQEILFEELLKDQNKEKEYKLFSAVKLIPDNSIIFNYKSELKKKEITKNKVLYPVLSAAASIILLIGMYVIIQNNSSSDNTLIQEKISQVKTEKTTEKKIEVAKEVEPEKEVFHALNPNIVIKNKKSDYKNINKVEDNTEINTPVIDRQSIAYLSPKDIKLDDIAVDNEIMAMQIYYIEQEIDVNESKEISFKTYLATNINYRLFKKKKEKIELFDIAQASVEGINKIAGTKMTLERVYDQNGKPNSTQFNSRLIAFSTPVKN